MKPRVVIFRSSLLAISETFIREQASAITSWEPILVGQRNIEGGLETPGVKREIVPESSIGLVRAFRFWLQRPIPDLVHRLKQLQASLVHAHFGPDATHIWPSVRAAGLPMIVTLHGSDINIDREWWEAGHGGVRRRVYPRRLLEMAKSPAVSFIAVSQAIKQKAIEYGIPEQKITVSYIGVDTERFKPSGLPIKQRQKRILFVGRMVEKKAPLLMVRSYAEVLKKVPEAELVMIGSGPLLEEAKRLARSLKVHIQFLGSCTSSEVLEQLHQARCFCLPSITASNGDAEGLPISILEAMACGVPTATSARGAVHEAIISGHNGLCFRELNQKEFSCCIEQVLSETSIACSFSSFGRLAAEDLFSIQKQSKELGRLYMSHANRPNKTDHQVSPFGGSARLIQRKSTSSIRTMYIQKCGVDVHNDLSEAKTNEIYLYQCKRTGYKFWRPASIAGNGEFYQKLSSAWPNYYRLSRWEHSHAKKHLKNRKTILEIGCGPGHFLRSLESLDIRASGIELNLESIDKKVTNFPIYPKSIEELSETNNKFDAIFAFQVLEHVSDPHKLIRSSISCLSKGGILMFSVPNNNYIDFFKQRDAFDLPPHHMGHFTPNTLKRIGNFLGLDTKAIYIQPRARNFSTSTEKTRNSISYKVYRDLSRTLSKVFYRVLRKPGENMLVVYQKK